MNAMTMNKPIRQRTGDDVHSAMTLQMNLSRSIIGLLLETEYIGDDEREIERATALHAAYEHLNAALEFSCESYPHLVRRAAK